MLAGRVDGSVQIIPILVVVVVVAVFVSPETFEDFLLSSSSGSWVVLTTKDTPRVKLPGRRDNRQTVFCHMCIHKYPCHNTRVCIYLLSMSQQYQQGTT